MTAMGNNVEIICFIKFTTHKMLIQQRYIHLYVQYESNEYMKSKKNVFLLFGIETHVLKPIELRVKW